jgi:nucleotide-binding universal stress UspA family protein
MIGHRSYSRPLTARDTSCLFPRVIAAIDFSAASLGAARWGIAHVATGADAVVAHIVPSSLDSSDDALVDSGDSRDSHGETAALRGGLGGFAATLDVASARSVVRFGRASRWLSDLAAESRAGLLILGRRADTNRRGIGEPNVLQRATRCTDASVLVVPEGTIEPPTHIVAAVDRSAVANRVVEHAQALARRRHSCTLTLVHVVSPTTESYDRAPRSSRRPSTASPPHAAHIPSPADRDHLHVLTGDPAREIVRHAEHNESALIVVGKCGDDGAPAGSLGSVARELLMRAPFPVLAIGEGA